jgi:hypothetical protein
MKTVAIPTIKSATRASRIRKDGTLEIQMRLNALNQFAGIMSKKRATEFLKHAKKVRSEWDRGY